MITINLIVFLAFWFEFRLSFANPLISNSLNRHRYPYTVQYIADEKHDWLDENKGKEKFKSNHFSAPASFNQNECKIDPKLAKEIQSYKPIVSEIFREILTGTFKHKTYRDLARFVDRFGSRIAGSANLENSIDYGIELMKKYGIENVHGEEVEIPHWVRGKEKAVMLAPRRKEIPVIGLGYSIGTVLEGITAPIVVAHNFEELEQLKDQVKGKIVVFNEIFESYGETVEYRSKGSTVAAKYGAVAVMVRSVTPFSLNTLHTGMEDNEASTKLIPACAITIEDAELLDRLIKEGKEVVINLQLVDAILPPVISRNIVGEIKGNISDDEVVIVSGHIDSWDVGQGAMDDGGGAFISLEALALIHHLGLRPRRTLRAVLWTSEEFGLIGAQDYIRKHMKEIEKIKAVFESDIGTFKPLGLDFAGHPFAACVVGEILKLMSPIEATTVDVKPVVGSDIALFQPLGVPTLSLKNQNEKYFYYHHSEADTMTVENPDSLDLCLALWTASSYIIADMSIELPRSPKHE